MRGREGAALIRGAGGLVLTLLSVAACSLDTGEVVEPGPARGDAAELARSARSAWEEAPRSEAEVREAFERMMAAVRATSRRDSLRFERLDDATRYALWLARHLPEPEANAFADSTLVLSNTAVAADSGRVEGYYWRSIAAGLVARDDKLKGRSAMDRIREDARRAIEIDPTFQEGGPHRVLGGLYLRAPGPPAGVGSTARALRHLQRAYEIAPDHPGNVLYLAEAYLEDGRAEKARPLLERARSLLDEADEAEDSVDRREWLRELEARLDPGRE